jgi:hypothetical protein
MMLSFDGSKMGGNCADRNVHFPWAIGNNEKAVS